MPDIIKTKLIEIVKKSLHAYVNPGNYLDVINHCQDEIKKTEKKIYHCEGIDASVIKTAVLDFLKKETTNLEQQHLIKRMLQQEVWKKVAKLDN